MLADLKTDASYTLFRSYGDYTTNLPVKDLRNKRAWVVFRFEGKDLAPEHGGPARLLVPHLYLWKSAKWVRGMTLIHHDKPSFWFAEAHLYMQCPGVVARCAVCEHVLLRLVSVRQRVFLAVRGMTYLSLDTAQLQDSSR